MSHSLAEAWYRRSWWLYILWPLSMIFAGVTLLRRLLFRHGIFSSWKAPVPVIVVGNITVGGTGKTPLVVALVKALQSQGYKPAVISRGYGSHAPEYPFSITVEKTAECCGDEPLLIARQTQVPVVIDANRVAAAKYLLQHHDCNIIVSDDGLQHYRLQRDLEILVVDGERGFGNNMLLPAGPLREPVKRLSSVHFVVSNGELTAFNAAVTHDVMTLQPQQLVNVFTDESCPIAEFDEPKSVHAIAGIGNPQRFFSLLESLGFKLTEHSFIDHHNYTVEDLQFGDNRPLLMTEKDAVKVRSIKGLNNCWYLPVAAHIEPDFFIRVIDQLRS